jgi:hypothetical protein
MGELPEKQVKPRPDAKRYMVWLLVSPYEMLYARDLLSLTGETGLR